MEPSLLKAVFISSKSYKKQLLIEHEEVSVLYTFLRDAIKNEVLIISTNFGLDVYYQSSFDCSTKIKDSFLKIISENSTQGECVNEYRIVSLNSKAMLKDAIKESFVRLCTMPLLFKSYSKSLVHQMKAHFSTNHVIIKDLFVVWQEVLNALCREEVYSQKIKQFKKNLESSYI